MEMSKRKNGGTVNLNSSAIVGLVDLPIVYRLWNGRKCSAVPLARGLSRLRLNKNSIVPIRINDFGHEIDNAVALSTMKGVTRNVKKAKFVHTEPDGD